jgi:hypothetical protein
MAGKPKLAGVVRLLVREDQKLNRKHRREEKEVASSPRMISRPERA